MLRGFQPLLLRARAEITSHFRIPSSGHPGPILKRKILNVVPATPAVLRLRIDPIRPKSGREFRELISARALSARLGIW